MIIDLLENLPLYLAMNPYFMDVVSFLEENDLSAAANGRYDIIGDKAFVTVGDNALRSESEAPLEAHDKYVDIQVVIRGCERQGWAPRGRCVMPLSEMNAERDIVFFSDRPSSMFTLSSGEMSIFFPGDAHAPLIGEGVVRKAVIKVSME